MNSLIPFSRELPVGVETSLRPYEPPPRASLRQLAGVLLGRIGLGLGVAVVIFLLVAGAASRMTPTYYSGASVIIQPQRENLAQADNGDQRALPPDTEAIDTEVEVLRSPDLARDVVQKLELWKDPEFAPMGGGLFDFGKQRDPNAAPSERRLASVTNAVMGRTYVRRVGLTYVVQVGFMSESPQKAQKIADTFVDLYLERQLAQKLEAVEKADKELSSKVESLRQEAQAAEAAVQEYKNAHNLMSSEGATMAEQEVSTLNQQIAIAKAATAERQARLAAAMAQVQRGSGGADVGSALASDTIRELRRQEAEKSVLLAQLEARFKPSYPEVQRARAELNDTRAQIQAELNRIMSSLRAEANAAAAQQSSLLGSRGAAQGGLKANNRAMVGLVALEQRAAAAKSIYEGYLNRAHEIAVEGSLQQADAIVNSRATLPTSPASPNMRLAMIFAAILGIIGGVAAILLAELWDKRLRNRTDVERELGVPFAGVLPDFATIAPRRSLRGANPADHLVSHPFTSFAEAFRNVRAFLMLSGRNGPSKVTAITSAVPREGKSMTSMCLARTLALSGSSVVLVDCDLRQRGVTKMSPGSEVGIIEVVEEGAALDQALVQDEKSGAWILPALERRNLPHDLFSKPAMDELLHTLSERFDYVVLDTPPILGVADARLIAAKADRVLYVAQWNKTPIRAAQSAIDILQECGANVVGALLSKVNVRQQARYGYGDSSDYFHYYRDYYITAA